MNLSMPMVACILPLGLHDDDDSIINTRNIVAHPFSLPKGQSLWQEESRLRNLNLLYERILQNQWLKLLPFLPHALIYKAP